MTRDSASNNINPRLDVRRIRQPETPVVRPKFQPTRKAPGSKVLTSRGWVEVTEDELDTPN